ncbi:MAG: hypothetical protein JWN17_1675, partial [Frankiales bacterium]|nr:hypothetical protein [Frankiales bacterium]
MVQQRASPADAPFVTRRPAALHPVALHPVALVTRWDGFCLPCGSDARPLALTWVGARGLRAWLAGHGWTDGELRLTCACCGGVDVVGWEDEPEPAEIAAPVEVDAAVEVEVEVGAPVAAPASAVVVPASPVGVPAAAGVVAPAPVPAAVIAPASVPAARVPSPAVVRVVRVLDLDVPDAVAVHGVAEVPAPRRPARAERRAAVRAGL